MRDVKFLCAMGTLNWTEFAWHMFSWDSGIHHVCTGVPVLYISAPQSCRSFGTFSTIMTCFISSTPFIGISISKPRISTLLFITIWKLLQRNSLMSALSNVRIIYISTYSHFTLLAIIGSWIFLMFSSYPLI